MDVLENFFLYDSLFEDELRFIDVALEVLERLKLGLSKMECVVCMYEIEFEYSEDLYDNRVYFFKQQFRNIYKGIGELLLMYIVQIEDNFLMYYNI